MITLGGFVLSKTDFRKSRNNNVCKVLKDDILVYTVFVDTKTTSPWTEFDIKTTMDSIQIALQWLTEQAKSNGIFANFKSDFYVGDEFTTIKRDLPEGSVRESVTSPNLRTGVENMNKWADYIAKKAGASLSIPEKDGIPEVKNPRNKERLVALLRDEHKVESVVLLFFVNNYYRDDISFAFNTTSGDDIEFAVVSYKYPSEIAHNILQLFGALDLHATPLRKSDKNINYALQEFPNEIMQNPYGKNIQSLQIDSFTRYMIGWTEELDPKYSMLLEEKGVKLK